MSYFRSRPIGRPVRARSQKERTPRHYIAHEQCRTAYLRLNVLFQARGAHLKNSVWGDFGVVNRTSQDDLTDSQVLGTITPHSNSS